MFYYFAAQQLITTNDPETGAQLTFPDRNLSNWDNLSGGRDFVPSQEEIDSKAVGPYSTPEACLEMCVSQLDCLQWKWRPRKCRLGNLPNLGRRPFIYWDPGNEDGTEEMISGWVEERIHAYVEKLGECDMNKAFE